MEVSNGALMKAKALSFLSVKSALKQKCLCPQKCISKMDFKTVREMRRSYWSHSKAARMQLLKHFISQSQRRGHFRFIFHPDFGVTLCSRAFQQLLNVNKNTFSRAISMEQKDALSIPTKKPRDMCDNSLLAIVWLEDYGTFYGDRMPDSNKIMLPYKTKKTALYRQYREECRESCISRAQFLKLWATRFPHMKVKQV